MAALEVQTNLPQATTSKCEEYSGRLREVVAYESLTAQGLLRGEVWTNLLFGENHLHAVSLF